MSISEPGLRQFVAEQIASGRHGSEDEVVEAALRQYRDAQTALDEHYAMVRAEAGLGLADIAAGRYERFDTVEDLHAALQRDLDELERLEAERMGHISVSD